MARADWLVKLRISCAIYLRATREKMASGLHPWKVKKSSKFVLICFWCLLSHCFSINYKNNYSPQCRWLAVDIYLAASRPILMPYSNAQRKFSIENQKHTNCEVDNRRKTEETGTESGIGRRGLSLLVLSRLYPQRRLSVHQKLVYLISRIRAASFFHLQTSL